MRVLTFPTFETFGHALSPAALESFQCGRFNNGELYVKLTGNVAREECIIVGSISPPEERLALITLLADTLKRDGAKKVFGVFPYLGYCRQDKELHLESRGAAWLGSLLKASGFDQIITCDIHSAAAINCLGLPTTSLSPAAMFAREIKNEIAGDFTLVSPDKGAIERCNNVRDALGLVTPITYLVKERSGLIVHSTLHGKVKERAIIIDDVLDTGATLAACAEQLQMAGAKEIYIFVTHGQFTGDRWMQLWDFAVKRIYCTDTIRDKFPIDTRLTVLKSEELFREFFECLK